MIQTEVSNPVQYRWAMLEALEKIKGHYQFELAKAVEWFESQDRELEAYHRGKARGLLFAIETIEATEVDLREAGVSPLEDDVVLTPPRSRDERRAGVA